MQLKRHYDKLYEIGKEQIKEDAYTIDHFIDSPSDKRYGVTLVLRPPEVVKLKIQSFLKDLQAIAPGQYYYPSSDIHIAVMSLISSYEGFELNQIHIKDYIELIRQCIQECRTFDIHYRGITATKFGVMIQGFPQDHNLNHLRDQLRHNFKKSDLQQSLDQRYTITTAHATVVRFRKELVQKERFLQLLESYRNYNFGSFIVSNLELVYNDWY